MHCCSAVTGWFLPHAASTFGRTALLPHLPLLRHAFGVFTAFLPACLLNLPFAATARCVVPLTACRTRLQRSHCRGGPHAFCRRCPTRGLALPTRATHLPACPRMPLQCLQAYLDFMPALWLPHLLPCLPSCGFFPTTTAHHHWFNTCDAVLDRDLIGTTTHTCLPGVFTNSGLLRLQFPTCCSWGQFYMVCDLLPCTGYLYTRPIPFTFFLYFCSHPLDRLFAVWTDTTCRFAWCGYSCAVICSVYLPPPLPTILLYTPPPAGDTFYLPALPTPAWFLLSLPVLPLPTTCMAVDSRPTPPFPLPPPTYLLFITFSHPTSTFLPSLVFPLWALPCPSVLIIFLWDGFNTTFPFLPFAGLTGWDSIVWCDWDPIDHYWTGTCYSLVLPTFCSACLPATAVHGLTAIYPMPQDTAACHHSWDSPCTCHTLPDTMRQPSSLPTHLFFLPSHPILSFTTVTGSGFCYLLTCSSSHTYHWDYRFARQDPTFLLTLL